MRLIDADELKMYDNKPCYTKIRKYQMDNHLEVLDSFSIDNVPTVEAIPMSVIEDIKAEIKEESRFCPLTEGLERALEIIDKYKAEREKE